MATSTPTTSRHGMLAAAATLPIAALSLSGAAVAAPVTMRDLLRNLVRTHDTYLGAGEAYRKRPNQSRLIFDQARNAYETAVQEVIWAAEDMA